MRYHQRQRCRKFVYQLLKMKYKDLDCGQIEKSSLLDGPGSLSTAPLFIFCPITENIDTATIRLLTRGDGVQLPNSSACITYL